MCDNIKVHIKENFILEKSDTMSVTFGARLAALRREKDLSQAELGKLLGVSASTIGMYEKDNRQPNFEMEEKIADFFNVDLAYLRGRQDVRTLNASAPNLQGIVPLPTGKRIPIIGAIACGTPILAQENIEGYLSINPDDGADFCLICKGDSMLPRCQNGDLVLIRKQPTVENGEIAAVRIGDEATLKKVYRSAPDQLMLIAENSDFPPIVLTKDEINTVSIEGKAIGFVRMF